jgi:hypothetical protein
MTLYDRNNNLTGTLGATLGATTTGTVSTFFSVAWAGRTTPSNQIVTVVITPAVPGTPGPAFEVIYGRATNGSKTFHILTRGAQTTTKHTHTAGKIWVHAPTAGGPGALTGDYGNRGGTVYTPVEVPPVTALAFDTATLNHTPLTYTATNLTLTAGANGACSVGGFTPSVGSRIAVAASTSTYHYGIYAVTVVGNATTKYVLKRAATSNTTAKLGRALCGQVVSGKWGPGSFFCMPLTIATFVMDTNTKGKINGGGVTSYNFFTPGGLYPNAGTLTGDNTLELYPNPQSHTSGVILYSTRGLQPTATTSGFNTALCAAQGSYTFTSGTGKEPTLKHDVTITIVVTHSGKLSIARARFTGTHTEATTTPGTPGTYTSILTGAYVKGGTATYGTTVFTIHVPAYWFLKITTATGCTVSCTYLKG